MTTQSIYDNNAEFREYVEKFTKKHHLTKEQAFEHLIVKNVAEYYNKKNEGKVIE